MVEFRLTCHVHQCQCLKEMPQLFMHNCLVTSLTGNQPYFIRGGLIPHLTKKGLFWKSQAPAIHQAVLKYRLHIDAVNSAHLNKVDKIDCGWTAPLPRPHHYDGAAGFHLSLGPDCALKNMQYWVKPDGTTAKAASPAPPPMPWSNSVQGLTQHFEQMFMRNTLNPVDMGHIPDRRPPLGVISGQLLAIISCHSTRNGQHQKAWRFEGVIDQVISKVISTIGRAQIKPATECFKGISSCA